MNRRRRTLLERLSLATWLRALSEKFAGLARLRVRRGNRRTGPSSGSAPGSSGRLPEADGTHDRGEHTARVTQSTPGRSSGSAPGSSGTVGSTGAVSIGVRASGTAPTWREVGLAAAWLIPVGIAIAAFATPVLGQQAVEGVRESRHFHVREVVVEGHRRLSESDVLTIAGITAGMSVLEADVDALAAPLRAHPWVRWAKVDRELPATLRVHLIEREACAYLATGDLWLVDETGEVFAPADPIESLDIPMISGLDRATLAEAVADPNQRIQLQVRLQGALNLARIWRIHGLARRYPIGEIRLDPVRGHVLVIGARGVVAPIEVVFGEGPLREKLQRLEFTLEALRAEGRHAEYVLLDLGDEPLGLLHGEVRSDQAGGALVGPGGTRAVGARVVVRATEPADEAAPEAVVPSASLDRTGPPGREAVTPGPTAPTEPTRGARRAESDPLAPPDETREATPLTGGRPADIPAGMEE